MSARTLLIGICGGTGAGKSTLITKLQQILELPTAHICMDDYYHDLADMPTELRQQQNFDQLEAIDVELLVGHLSAVRTGQPIDIPTYDFATHARQTETRQIQDKRIIFVDGIMLLAAETIRQQLDLSIFLQVKSETRFERRLQRDITSRGRTPESVHRQWQDTVEPFYQSVVAPSSEFADVVIQASDVNRIIAIIGQLLGGRRG